jgi:hypothetical protein
VLLASAPIGVNTLDITCVESNQHPIPLVARYRTGGARRVHELHDPDNVVIYLRSILERGQGCTANTERDQQSHFDEG